ncbi:hypothetical protein AURDEDRAFT_82703 [Auricularia subglabra TFB-10046 SS5]|nr:hypothetical protein AURDEDRAFT_82703 [Auricularia subglabra TFB-10046 SS5]
METTTTTEPPAPRRSGRERKPAAAITVSSERPKKRKRATAADKTDDEGAATGDDAAPDAVEDDGVVADDDEGSDTSVDKPKRKRVVKRVGQAKKAAGTAPAGKARAAARKGKKAAAGDDEAAAFDPAQVAKETRISEDNALFNAMINPAAALQSTAEDFLESYNQDSELALAELVNCILRAAGCNASVDKDEVMDEDGAVDKLDEFSEALMKETTLPYPLSSKLPIFKKFRKSLAELLHRLVAAASDLGVLDDEKFMKIINTWVVAMSSSQLRSFRHTATVIALEIETALCDVGAAADKEAETLVRQRDAEKKKKGRSGDREKELEAKSRQANARRTALKGHLKGLFDGVFVHRCRDHHSEIRAECMHALGTWLKIYSAHFLEGSYLRYVGWLLSDADTHVRLEAVKSLVALYSKDDYIVTLRNFTERFKGRLLEMARSDTELSIRVASIQVLCTIDAHSLLEDEHRDQLCILVFDQEARIRKAISAFVRGIWTEDVGSRLSGRKAAQKDKQRAGVKSLAALLVAWSKAVQSQTKGPSERDEDEPSTSRDVALLVSPLQKGRIALAVEGLWDEVAAVSDWEGLLEHLLLDHSAQGDAAASVTPSRRKKAAKAADDDAVDPAWRLEEEEESCILEVFVACIRKSVAEGKKTDGDTTQADITRTLMTALPRLFAKYQTDDNRICDVLIIPEFLSLDLFLEMRVISSYEALWDDVNKQFLSSSNPAVLNHAVETIKHFMGTTSLSNTNSTKILELEDELSSSLRDAVAGRDELEIATFSDDEIHALSAVAMRINILFGFRDMMNWMEEDEGGKQSSAWDILVAIAERGALGYKEEEELVERCVNVLSHHVIWKARRLRDRAPSPDDDAAREMLLQQRDALLEKLTEFAVGSRSKPCEKVARAAFCFLTTIYVLFNRYDPTAPASDLDLSMDEQTQYRCAGFVQAELERYADDAAPANGADDADKTDDSGAESGSDSDGATKTKGKSAKKANVANGNGAASRVQTSRNSYTPTDATAIPLTRLEREYAANRVAGSFLAALSVGAIDLKHAPVLLAHYDRLEPSLDMHSRRIVDLLRQEGMYHGRGEVVASVVTQSLKDAFNLYLEDVVQTESHAVALAKALAPSFIIRGAQLAVVRRLESQHLVAVHTNGISWIIKQVQTHDTNSNMKMKRKALMFFKVLAPLLASIENRDALKIKAHLDQALSLARLDMGVGKEWDPLRTYEKRLSNKDKTIVPTAKPKRGRAKKAGDATSDEEGTDGEKADAAAAGGEGDKPKKPARARAPRKPRASKKGAASTDDDEAFTGPTLSRAPTAARRRSQRKVNGKTNLAESDGEATSGAEASGVQSGREADDAMDEAANPPAVNGYSTPRPASPTKKRPRADDDDDDEPAVDGDSPQSLSKFKSRRKRARAAL